MIVTTTSHLEARLQDVDHRPRALLDQARFPAGVHLERSELEEEREGMKRCLKICAEASKNVIRRMQELAITSSNEDAATVERQQGLRGSSESSSADRQGPDSKGRIQVNIFEDIVAPRNPVK